MVFEFVVFGVLITSLLVLYLDAVYHRYDRQTTLMRYLDGDITERN